MFLTTALLMVASAARAAVWTPPIGIPAPSFGIHEVAPAPPNPWTVSTAGFYYVDATKAAATDSNNTYGTPAKPRRTIPLVLPAGAVVELHGTYDQAHGSPATIVAQGTAANPVFLRGVNAASRPIVRRSWEVKGTYMIIENLEFGPMPNLSSTGSMVIRLPASHVVVRHSDLHGTPHDGGLGIVNWEVGYGEVYTGPGMVDHVVIYNNTIHDNGDLNATNDQDVHGIHVTDHVNHLWVVDNQLYRNSGDGIQIVAPAPGTAHTTHHIYVGRNVSHHNKQTGFWVKQATDVIFSQNVSYGHRPGNSSNGQCMGGQYAPDWVWFIYNHLSDCEYGVALMSDDKQFSRTFVIGNLIHNIHRTTSNSGPHDAFGSSAVMMAGGHERHVVNNTIVDVDSGVNIATPVGSLDLSGNIIANVTQPAASHMLLAFSALAAKTSLHHDVLFGDPRINAGNGQVHLTAGQLAQVQSLASDPQFVNAAGGDFHLQSTSPAIGAGDVNSVYATFQQRYGLSIATDIEGTPRPATDYALGAFEKVCAAAPSIPEAPLGFTASATSTTISLQWPAPAVVGCTPAPTYIPGVPGTLASTMTTTTMKLTWGVPTSGATVTAYVLEAGTAPGLKDRGTFTLSATATALSGNKPPKGTYYFRVKAKNSAGTGSSTNEIKIIVP